MIGCILDPALSKGVSLFEDVDKPPEKRAIWIIHCGRYGFRIAPIGASMTASEANRQRVLTLLLVEREQMCAEFGNFYKETPAMNRGEWSQSETSPLSTVEHVIALN